jgi:hypothetical protein
MTIMLAPVLAALLLTAGAPPSEPGSAAPGPAATAPGERHPDAAPVDWRTDPRYGLLTPLPDRGAVPPIVELLDRRSPEDEAVRARHRQYEQQVQRLRHDHFRQKKGERRAEGIAQIDEFVDPASFQTLIERLSDEGDDVREALLQHFAEQGEDGQAALAWIFIHDDDEAFRNEALRHMVSPVEGPVLAVLDQSLRSPKHATANNAGTLAGALNVVQAIPLLIFAQATQDEIPADQGDLAWIAIGTQIPFVANLQPVVGDNAGAFQPVIGVVNEGVVLRVMDAVVVVYRTEVHRSLVAMSSREFGESTAHLGYDMPAWWAWYNGEFVPHLRARLRAG